MTGDELLQVARIVRFSLTSADAESLCGFYEEAFGFRCLTRSRRSGADFERLMDVAASATSLVLMLGHESVELLEFDAPGNSYPASPTSADLDFQHFALVVADMESAYHRLLEVPGWTQISTGGPVRLPQSCGNVTAFKFRDPEGHPLELLAFPSISTPARWQAGARSDLFLGIDHSAISVRDSARSLAFYRALGLRVRTQTLNAGSEQERLDALGRPEVKVTSLSPSQDGPHLELLCYLNIAPAAVCDLRNNDVAATRTVFELAADQTGSGLAGRALRDPDGHHIQVISGTSNS